MKNLVKFEKPSGLLHRGVAWSTPDVRSRSRSRSSTNVLAPFGSQSLFLLVTLREVVNSSFALCASLVKSRVLHFSGQSVP